MVALINDLERSNTVCGLGAFSHAQLKASLTAATALIKQWKLTEDLYLPKLQLAREGTQRSKGRQASKISTAV